MEKRQLAKQADIRTGTCGCRCEEVVEVVVTFAANAGGECGVMIRCMQECSEQKRTVEELKTMETQHKQLLVTVEVCVDAC